MDSKKRNNQLHKITKYIENLAKNGYFKRLSQNKIKQLNKIINKQLNKFNQQKLQRTLKKASAVLRRDYIKYLQLDNKKHNDTQGFKVNNKGISIQAIKRIKPVLENEFKQANLRSINLIKTQSPFAIDLIKRRMWNWIYANDENKASKESLELAIEQTELMRKQDKHFQLILRDQSHKMRGNLDLAIANNLGAIAFIWNTRKDNRVVGNPSGLYPKDTISDEKMHGNHYERSGKLYFYHNSWAIQKGYINTKAKGFMYADFKDGMPSVPINCRCTCDNKFTLTQIQKINPAFITKAGLKYIQNNTLY